MPCLACAGATRSLLVDMYDTFMIRIGWYRNRRKTGHPITLRRALFSDMPRFGSYEEYEVGCPHWALRAYEVFSDG